MVMRHIGATVLFRQGTIGGTFMASPSLWCWCFVSQADQFDPAQLQDKLQKDALAVLKDESNPPIMEIHRYLWWIQ